MNWRVYSIEDQKKRRYKLFGDYSTWKDAKAGLKLSMKHKGYRPEDWHRKGKNWYVNNGILIGYIIKI